MGRWNRKIENDHETQEKGIFQLNNRPHMPGYLTSRCDMTKSTPFICKKAQKINRFINT